MREKVLDLERFLILAMHSSSSPVAINDRFTAWIARGADGGARDHVAAFLGAMMAAGTASSAFRFLEG
jgi:hypothetical protein